MQQILSLTLMANMQRVTVFLILGICCRSQNYYVALRFQTFILDIGDMPLIHLFVKNFIGILACSFL